MGQVGQVCWDLLMAELKDKRKIFNAKLSLETSEDFSLWVVCWGHRVRPGHTAACTGRLEGAGNKQLLQSKRSKRWVCASSLVSPLARQEYRHCLGCGTGVQILGFTCKTSARDTATYAAAVWDLSDTVMWTSLFSLLFGTSADKTYESSIETGPAKQNQNKAPDSNIDTKMSVYNKTWSDRIEEEARLIVGYG